MIWVGIGMMIFGFGVALFVLVSWAIVITRVVQRLERDVTTAKRLLFKIVKGQEE